MKRVITSLERVDNMLQTAKDIFRPLVLGIWGTFEIEMLFLSFGFLQVFVVILRVLYFESQVAEVLRRLSPVQPAVAGTFTSFLHNKMDWSEDDNVS